MSQTLRITRATSLCVRVFVSTLLLLQVACTQHFVFVSPYDRVLDEGVSKVHADLAAFTARMGTLSGKPEGTYEANQAFYADAKAQVETLSMRARVQEKNDITVKQFKELSDNVERLRLLHESGKAAGLPSAIGKSAMSAIDINCTAIIKFEIAKKDRVSAQST